MSMIPFSILDLSPVTEGSTPAEALRQSLKLAQQAEQLGYHRFWVAEHHNFPGVASAATAVVLGYIAGGTSRIRVGAGGIMLPNHSPLVVAEQFGTLESLYPGRVDLGLGRAPGTDPRTAQALRRNLASSADRFPEDVAELARYLEPAVPGQAVRAVPGAGTRVPIWILGSSLFGARLAAHRGLPYSFASHFAPAQLLDAIEVYRSEFRPSDRMAKPYVMLGFNVFVADSDEEARLLSTSLQQVFVNLRRGMPTQLPPPVEGYEEGLSPIDRALLAESLLCTAAGAPDTVAERLQAFIDRTQPDELMLTSQIFDFKARLRSFELAAQLRDRLG